MDDAPQCQRRWQTNFAPTAAGIGIGNLIVGAGLLAWGRPAADRALFYAAYGLTFLLVSLLKRLSGSDSMRARGLRTGTLLARLPAPLPDWRPETSYAPREPHVTMGESLRWHRRHPPQCRGLSDKQWFKDALPLRSSCS